VTTGLFESRQNSTIDRPHRFHQFTAFNLQPPLPRMPLRDIDSSSVLAGPARLLKAREPRPRRAFSLRTQQNQPTVVVVTQTERSGKEGRNLAPRNGFVRSKGR